MTGTDLAKLMSELLNKDRLNYIEIIANRGSGIKSIDVTKEILKLKGIKLHPEKVKKENIKVNKRLRKLVDLDILSSNERAEYTISNLGYLLMDSWRELTEKAETMSRFRDFFSSHYITDLPPEFFRQIYKLKRSRITENPLQWEREVKIYMKKIERKFYNLTEYLHDFPEEIIEKKKRGEIEEIVIIYEFNKYPELNYSDEKIELLNRLSRAGTEFRYMNLKDRYPIGLRIVDEKWATFGLAKIPEGELDRAHAFIGTDSDFISWCRDLMYHMWHFEAKPLNVEDVMERGE